MKEPRDIYKYVTSERASAFLRSVADGIDANKGIYPLIKIGSVNISHWNPAWVTPPKAKKGKK